MVKDDRGIVLRQAFGRRLRAVRVLRGFKTGDELASAIGTGSAATVASASRSMWKSTICWRSIR